MSDPDIDLMLRIREGDTEAFGELFDRHGRGLYGFFHWYGLRRDDAEDGVQEVFQRVWQAREHYEPTGKVRAWLVRIATNWLIDRGRMKQRRPSERSLDAPMDGSNPDSGRMLDRIEGRSEDPAAPLERRQLGRDIEAAIERLPEGPRLVFLMGAREGIRYREISRVLGIPEGTVKSRMHAAVHQLRDILLRSEDYRG